MPLVQVPQDDIEGLEDGSWSLKGGTTGLNEGVTTKVGK